MHRVPLTIAAALALVLGLLPPSPAAAACGPPGGVDIGWVAPDEPGDFYVLGGGWGHGVGMSQHGAQGAATLGCSAEKIVTTYYPGTVVAGVEDTDIRVGLYAKPSLPSAISVTAVKGTIPWDFSGGGGPGGQPQGTTWKARSGGDGRLRVERHDGSTWTAPAAGGAVEAIMGSDGSRMVRLPAKGRRYRWGRLRFEPDGGSGRMFVTVQIPSIHKYLYGLAEMPSSWHTMALQAQAITGRSYAHTRRGIFGLNGKTECRCTVLDSPRDQSYTGYEKEGETVNGYHWGKFWVAAVDASAGKVLTYDGKVVAGFYSSSHGGQSERLSFSSFYNPVPNPAYLQPVDDSRWERANPSKVMRWAESYTREEMTKALEGYGIGTVQTIDTPFPKGAGGRVGNPARKNPEGASYGGVEVVGSKGRVVLSGLELIRALQGSALPLDRRLRYRSELFRVGTSLEITCLPASDQSDNTIVRRSAGPDRVATAVAVSAEHWDTAADVILATSLSFPDALSAGALAARLGAPVLLTPRDQLHPAVRAELQRLGAVRVHMMGGIAALGTPVAHALHDDGYSVRRIAGAGRVDTARLAALEAGPSETREVALANAGNWPDAVAAGALAGSPDRIPVLLSGRDDVPEATMQALAELDAKRVILVGGPAVLAGGVVDELRAAGYGVSRLSGATRYETSLAVARDAAERSEGPRPVVLATGGLFPDALAAGGLVARLSGGLVLTTRCSLGAIPDTWQHLADGPYEGGVIVGGTAAVSDLVREQATAKVKP